MSEDRWLVVGLGNPGQKYELNRHNIGQMGIDLLAENLGQSLKTHKTNSRVAEGRLKIPGAKIVLLKPNSFMNLSGGPVSAAAKYFNVPAERIIVLHDELDIPFGSLKIKKGGGHGGHNGLRDIAKALGTPEFIRVRMGVGRPPGRQDPADYVLSNFASAQKDELGVLIAEAAEAVQLISESGLIEAQQIVHSRSRS